MSCFDSNRSMDMQQTMYVFHVFVEYNFIYRKKKLEKMNEACVLLIRLLISFYGVSRRKRLKYNKA